MKEGTVRVASFSLSPSVDDVVAILLSLGKCLGICRLNFCSALGLPHIVSQYSTLSWRNTSLDSWHWLSWNVCTTLNSSNYIYISMIFRKRHPNVHREKFPSSQLPEILKKTLQGIRKNKPRCKDIVVPSFIKALVLNLGHTLKSRGAVKNQPNQPTNPPTQNTLPGFLPRHSDLCRTDAD